MMNVLNKMKHRVTGPWFGLAMVLFSGSCWQQKAKPEIFYINSYHKGYVPSDQIFEGIKSAIDTSEVKLTHFYLDAKRASAAELEVHGERAFQLIRERQPDVVIVSDDNAMQSVVMKHLAQSAFPVVFCGVNWSHQQYELDHNHITGMLEVLPVTQCISIARSSGVRVDKITILSEQSVAEEKTKQYLVPLLEKSGVMIDYRMVGSFNEWKVEFVAAQGLADLIFVPTQGAIKGWNKNEAVEFISAHIRKPVFTCDDFMMPYACYGLTKVAREQGEWAAWAAIKILNGSSPAEIPFAANQKQNCYVNEEMCKMVQLTIPDSLLKACNTTYDF